MTCLYVAYTCLYVDTWGLQQFFNKVRKLGIELETLALIPCQASCTNQLFQKTDLMERARQSTYTHQHNQDLNHTVLSILIVAELDVSVFELDVSIRYIRLCDN